MDNAEKVTAIVGVCSALFSLYFTIRTFRAYRQIESSLYELERIHEVLKDIRDNTKKKEG